MALWPEFDLTSKEIFYAGIWGSNVNFGIGPNGQDLANIEIDYYVGITPKVGKWNFDIATYYVTYPGAFDPGGEFDYVEIWTSVSRNLFNDKLELKLYNYWSPEYFGETGNNEVLEFNSEWTLNKVWYFTPKLSGKVGHQWGNLRVSRWLLPTLAAAYAYPNLGGWTTRTRSSRQYCHFNQSSRLRKLRLGCAAARWRSHRGTSFTPHVGLAHSLAAHAPSFGGILGPPPPCRGACHGELRADRWDTARP